MHTIDQAPWYKHRWPWFLMLGPAVVIVAGSYMSYLAFSHQDALVEGDYYKKGKAINQDLRRDREAAQRAIAAGFQFDGNSLRGEVRSHGAPLQGAFELYMGHATQPEKDVRLFVRTDAEGRFMVSLPPLAASRWQVVLTDAAHSWRVEGDWAVPQQTVLQLKADTQ